MKKLFCLIVLLIGFSLCGCYDSHIRGVDENGRDVIIHGLDVGTPIYYPGMVLWDCGVAWPVTIAEFYSCMAVFVPPALLTYNGAFIGYDGLLQNTMGVVIFKYHLPFLPASEIDYDIEHGGTGKRASCHSPKPTIQKEESK